MPKLFHWLPDIMKKFGADNKDFQIRINSRSLLDDVLEKINIDKDQKQFVYRLIDKKKKCLMINSEIL